MKPTSDKCSCGWELVNKHTFKREGEQWLYGDCLPCNLRHEFREIGPATDDLVGPVEYVRSYTIPDDG